MSTNTVKDFLETVKTDRSGITCPACGSILGIRKQGSYEMHLTENARLELDGSITNYRSFLAGIESILEQINIYGINPIKGGNYPYSQESEAHRYLKEGGIYQETEGARSVESFIHSRIDYFELIENFYSLPRLSDLTYQPESDLEKRKSTHQKETLMKLIKGLEPRSISGPLVELIFEQFYVSRWMEQLTHEREQLDCLLEEVSPYLQEYLKLYQGEEVLRIKFILAIMLGHKSHENIETVASLGIKTNVPFTLPRITVVSPKSLQALLLSEVVIGNPNLGWEEKFVESVRQVTSQEDGHRQEQLQFSQLSLGQRQSQPGQNQENGRIVDSIVDSIGDQINKFIYFTCTGPAGDHPDGVQHQETALLGEEPPKCGWYPKPEKTHSVVLLGSPGTGKSSVMLTGFTTFYTNVAVLGATVIFDSPEDEAHMKELTKKYWEGKMPIPSPRGARTSIKLSVEFPTGTYQKTNFVFTDIPGEVAARSLTEEGPDPAVLRILKNAETIIFFFDLSIEPSIREKFIQGDEEEVWTQLKNNYERVNQSRNNAAEVSQLQLLQKLIRDLQGQKGTEKMEGTKFICVIPKADLFVNEYQEERFFFTSFYNTLKDRQVLVPSRHNRDDSFWGLYSLGGTGVQIEEPLEEPLEDRVKRQQKIGQLISSKARQCLQEIGKALGEEQELNPIRESLSDTLQVQLIARLHKVFGQEDRVYYLPVSAQGKDSENNELNHPPNQKLSEYVFILPVALSATENKSPSQPIPNFSSNSSSSKNLTPSLHR